MTATKLKKEDPPASINTRNAYKSEAAEIQASPGVWFVLREWKNPDDKKKTAVRALAGNINRGRVAAFRPAGAFEAAARLHADNTMKVHVRYLTDDDGIKAAEE